MLWRTLLVLALAANPLAAQNSGKITGKITDAVTRQPIARVQVGCLVLGEVVSVRSGPDGAYTLENVPPGDVGMYLNLEGYKLISDNWEPSARFRIGAGDSITRNFTMHPLGRIYGRLTDRGSGNLLAGHAIVAELREYVPGTVFYGSSDAQPGGGEFEILGLETGDYVIAIESPGEAAVSFPPQRSRARPAPARVYGLRYYPDVARREMAVTIHLGEGEARRVDISLQGAEPHTLSGTVIAPAGFEHQQISFAFRTGGPVGLDGPQMTGPGPFRVENLAPGKYRLGLTAGVPPHQFAADYEIAIADRDVEDFKATLIPEAGVSGEIRMLEENAKVPDGIGFRLIPTSGWWAHAGKRGWTSGDLPVPADQAKSGRIRQDSIRPGEYWPEFMLPDGYAVAEVRFEGANARNNVIAVSAPDTPLTVVLTSRPGAVGGVVRSDDQPPVRGAEVALLPDPLPDRIAPSTIQFTESGEAGTFLFKNVAPGMYRAIVLKGDEDVRSAGAALRDAAAKAEAIEVRAGQSASVNLKP